jgi:hypothetical protein
MVRSCLCSTVFTVLIFGIHIMLFFLIHGSTSKEIFFERIAFVCIILMYIFRLFTMVRNGITFLNYSVIKSMVWNVFVLAL